MSKEDAVYKQALLSESTLDDGNGCTSIYADDRAIDVEYYPSSLKPERRARKLRAGFHIASLVLNVVLLITLASVYAHFRQRAEWAGVPQVWSSFALRLLPVSFR